MPELWEGLEQQPVAEPISMWPDERQAAQAAFEAAAARTRRPYREAIDRDPTSSGLYQNLDRLLAQPSWLQRATEQSEKDRAAYQEGGVPALMADTAGGQELAGGFGGTTIGGKTGAAILAMDEASRLKRATEQGFTRDAYRGEGSPIVGDQFITGHPGRYDPGFLGGDAIYATNRPFLANDYAMLKGAREFPGQEAQNVMPLKVKMDNPLVISGEDKRQIAGLDRFERDDWLRNNVYGKGHDGVVVKYGGGDPTKRSSGYEEYVAPANQYRSRFAAFDPAKKDNGNLLASLAALFSGGMAAPSLLSSEQR